MILTCKAFFCDDSCKLKTRSTLIGAYNVEDGRGNSRWLICSPVTQSFHERKALAARGERAAKSVPGGKSGAVLRRSGLSGGLRLPVHAVAFHRFAMTPVLFLMQVEARGVQRHVTEIVAHRA